MKKRMKIYSALLLVPLILLSACGGEKAIVGTWVMEGDDDMLVFEKDGTCSAPFTYNSSWWESADHYAITEDGTLVFSSEGGHADDSFEKAEDEEEALDKSNTYYLSDNILIIDGETYSRAE